MGPFKCPDCGIWWAGFEHRCRIETPPTAHPVTACSCVIYPPTADSNCPAHRYDWTYTYNNTNTTADSRPPI